MEFQLAFVQIFFLWFLTMFVHYLSQYFICLIMGIKVTRFDPKFYKIDIEYSSKYFYHELIIVTGGIFGNSACFSIMAFIAFFSKFFFNCFPRIYYKIISFYGVYCMIDPLLILLIDIFSQSWVKGDWFRMYHYYENKEGAGFMGAYITMFLMIGMIIVNGFLLYVYMI